MEKPMETPERENYYVRTRIGMLHVWTDRSRHRNTLFPAINVEMHNEDGGIPIACVEYDAFSDEICTHVFGDIYADGATHDIIHTGLKDLWYTKDETVEKPEYSDQTTDAEWVEVLHDEDPKYGGFILFHCSSCDTPNARRRNFCPECGRKMLNAGTEKGPHTIVIQ